MFLERVLPEAEADRYLQLKFVCPAPYFANALLYANGEIVSAKIRPFSFQS